jgi:hypothetical protein
VEIDLSQKMIPEVPKLVVNTQSTDNEFSSTSDSNNQRQIHFKQKTSSKNMKKVKKNFQLEFFSHLKFFIFF